MGIEVFGSGGKEDGFMESWSDEAIDRFELRISKKLTSLERKIFRAGFSAGWEKA